MTKEIIQEKLKTSEMRFHFTFADKRKTSVLCTLDFSKIPKESHDKIGPPIKELIVAWDIENLRWIAFKQEKIVRIENK